MCLSYFLKAWIGHQIPISLRACNHNVHILHDLVAWNLKRFAIHDIDQIQIEPGQDIVLLPLPKLDTPVALSWQSEQILFLINRWEGAAKELIAGEIYLFVKVR